MLTWEDTILELRMYKALEAEFGPGRASEFKQLYETARRKLVEDVLPRSPVAEPDMTDHTAAHVASVMANANRLIGPTALEKPAPSLSAADAYILCLAIFFHDVGMAFGREGHEQRIPEIYAWVRGSESRPIRERTLLHWIASSHTGRTSSCSKDTLTSVPANMDLDGERVQAQELAAILRFADELSEDPKRTSTFVTEQLGIGERSEVYHDYANVTGVYVDRAERRVTLRYEVNIADDDDAESTQGVFAVKSQRFHKLLAFTFRRIVKLDRERRYASSYSAHIAPFNRTEVTLNFWTRTELIHILGPLELSDRTILDRQPAELKEIDARYDVSDVIRRIQDAIA